jgi:manganese/iron transport system permease protein
VAFDQTLARSLGYNVFALDLVLLLLLTGTVVVSLQTVGNILVLALLVTPPAAARLLSDRFGIMVALSAIAGVASGVTGLYISYYTDLAAGGMVVLAATSIFVLTYLFAPNHGVVAGYRQRRRGQHHVHHYHPAEEEVAGG